MDPVSRGLDLQIALRQGAFELDVALTVAPGETLVLVGPSGSGKTTCLRAVAGLARPHAGHVTIAGRRAFDASSGLDLPPWKRGVGVVFQDYALFPHLSVLENVRYGLRGLPDAAARARSWLDALGLSELAARKPGQLSGGQQQRVALARAAATDSRLLLLDEPFGSLDTATRRSVRGELRRFLAQAASGAAGPRATVLVSHDYLDALTLGDRIAVLEEGRLTQVGSRDEVLRRPRTPFLAALTGHNVLEGTLLPAAPGSDLREVQVGPLRFHAAGGGELPEGPVFVAFGPEEVSLLAHQTEISARNQFTARVQEVAPLPDRLRLYLDAGVPLMADVVRSAAAALHLAEGAPVIAAVKSTAVQIYR